MLELEYKVAKAMFSINKIQEVKQVEIDPRDISM